MNRTNPSVFKLRMFVGCCVFVAFVASFLLMMQYIPVYSRTKPIVEGINTKETSSILPSESEKGIAGAPIRIQIPKIGVDATIEQVGLQSDGAMGVPSDPMNAGWYALGPRPGETGSAVLDGHVDWWQGASAVFENLHTLVAGDVMTIENDRGERMSFVVRKSKIYTASARADDIFFAKDTTPHLNIITCSGTWNSATQQYEDRLVIFTDLQ